MAICCLDKYNRCIFSTDGRLGHIKIGQELVMKKILVFALSAVFVVGSVAGQNPQKPREEVAPEDIIRITTNLVQTDVVVTDKNDRPIPDLTLEDFEVYDNGRKQELKFIEFISTDTPRLGE